MQQNFHYEDLMTLDGLLHENLHLSEFLKHSTSLQARKTQGGCLEAPSLQIKNWQPKQCGPMKTLLGFPNLAIKCDHLTAWVSVSAQAFVCLRMNRGMVCAGGAGKEPDWKLWELNIINCKADLHSTYLYINSTYGQLRAVAFSFRNDEFGHTGEYSCQVRPTPHLEKHRKPLICV